MLMNDDYAKYGGSYSGRRGDNTGMARVSDDAFLTVAGIGMPSGSTSLYLSFPDVVEKA